MKKLSLVFFLAFLLQTCWAQQEVVDFDEVDSLIATTPAIYLCLKDGQEDLRFFSKTPEKYSNYAQVFANQMASAFSFDSASHFFCDITVEVSCEGKAGNYLFGIEPRTFSMADFSCLKQLVVFVNKLRDYEFTPAYYLGENVNTKVKLRLEAKDGVAVIK